MAGLLDYLKQYEVKPNTALETFLTTLEKQRDALAEDKLTRRSWAKPDGNGFRITLGKLEGEYSLPSKQEATEFFQLIASDARTDEDFKSLVEAAYGEPLGEEPPVKKPRKKREPKAAAVDTDVLSITLRPRT
jgi:hypothetical protein